MKAISILQPWASLILAGEKQVETRSWRTCYRGPLLIHAGTRLSLAQRRLLVLEPYQSRLTRQEIRGLTQLPRGVVLGFVDLVDCVPTEAIVETLSEQERDLGDFGVGQWAWLLEKPRLLPKPLPFRGALGLFEIEDSLLHNEMILPIPSQTSNSLRPSA